MNKLVYGIIALVVIAAVGVGAYFVVGQKPSDSTEVTSELPTEEPTEAPGVSRESASFSDMISKGQNQMCTFSDSETESVGTVFIGDGNVKADFQTGDSEAVVSHLVLLNGEDAYMWMEGETQGFTTSLSQISELSAASGQTNAFLDVNKAVDYECYPWDADQEQFDLPESVEFQDMSSMLRDAIELQNQL